jgi:hypothetical protein
MWSVKGPPNKDNLREGVSRGERRRQGKGGKELEMENNVLYVDKCPLGHLLAPRGRAVRYRY